MSCILSWLLHLCDGSCLGCGSFMRHREIDQLELSTSCMVN
ncbi:hypothetical protein SOVF_200850 [Spinacia oleracea]|nr:hypothetical protein SOVF_200850 [Spinacia oleracea]